jgi:NAD(P)-dependent dehydrogenase (short-subunit alcohol dehydrogenase family)
MTEIKKVALITGASDGIGAGIAIELAQKNIHTIITGRSLSSIKTTENTIIENGGTCTFVELDMRDFLGIDRLGLEIFNRWKRLDILISNAAILGTLGPLHHQNNDEFLDVFNINLISNHRLIRSFDALLKNSLNPKAIFLTASVSYKSKPFWGAYSISKAALNHMAKIWSLENKHNNLSISIIDPGNTNTKLRKKAIPGENIKNLQDPMIIGKIIANLSLSEKIYKGDIISLKDLEN